MTKSKKVTKSFVLLLLVLSIFSTSMLTACGTTENSGNGVTFFDQVGSSVKNLFIGKSTSYKNAEVNYDSSHFPMSLIVKIPLIGGLIGTFTGYNSDKQKYALSKEDQAKTDGEDIQLSFLSRYGIYIIISLIILLLIILKLRKPKKKEQSIVAVAAGAPLVTQTQRGSVMDL